MTDTTGTMGAWRVTIETLDDYGNSVDGDVIGTYAVKVNAAAAAADAITDAGRFTGDHRVTVSHDPDEE